MRNLKISFNLKHNRVVKSTYLEKKKIAGTVPVFGRITVDGNRSEFSINEFIDPKRWDRITHRVKGEKEDAQIINNHIEAVIADFKRIYNNLREKNEYISTDRLLRIYDGKEKSGLTLMKLYDNLKVQFQKDIDDGIFKKSTWEKYEDTHKKLQGFIKKKYNLKDNDVIDIEVSLLNKEFIKDFNEYIRENGIEPNSRVKQIKNLKRIINFGVEEELLEFNPLNNFKAVYKFEGIKYLTFDELQKIENHDFAGNKRLEIARDIFIFGCYTGISFADLFVFTHDDFSTRSDGTKYINFDRIKTNSLSVTPILTKAWDIYMKYKDQCTNHILPLKSYDNLREILKLVAYECGLKKKNLTYHQSRHTFAATVAAENEVDVYIVKEILGHKDIRTTQHYYKLSNSAVHKGMRKLDEKLNQQKKEHKKDNDEPKS